jgi:hypothetical protein
LNFKISFAIAFSTFVLITGGIGMESVQAQLLELTDIFERETIERILDYCYEHADSPNPVKDLVDKGLVPQKYNSETCGSIKLTYDKIVDYLGR